MTSVGVVVSGDPRRKHLAHHLAAIYRTYPFVREVKVYFEANTALAVNRSAREMTTDWLVAVGGDMYIGEEEMRRFVAWGGDVVFTVRHLYPLDTHPYPAPYTVVPGAPFMGAFRCIRELLVACPMPTSPPFVEDVLWERQLRAEGVRFVGVVLPAVHVDYHTVWHGWRRLIYMARAPERFPGWDGQRGARLAAFAFRSLILHVLWDLVFRWLPVRPCEHRHRTDEGYCPQCGRWSP